MIKAQAHRTFPGMRIAAQLYKCVLNLSLFPACSLPYPSSTSHPWTRLVYSCNPLGLLEGSPLESWEHPSHGAVCLKRMVQSLGSDSSKEETVGYLDSPCLRGRPLSACCWTTTIPRSSDQVRQMSQMMERSQGESWESFLCE